MHFFLLAFFSLYSSLHLYVFFRIRSLLSLGPLGSALLSAFLAFMVFSPVLAIFLTREGPQGVARIFAFLSFGWMAFAFLLFFISLCLDVLSFFLSSIGFPLRPYSLAILSLALPSLCLIYGLFEAESIRVKTVEIKTRKLPPGTNLAILHITDLHLGVTTRGRQARNMFEVMRKQDVDLILCSGDVVDGEMGQYVESFSQLRARLGKFAVTGNHEFYMGLRKSEEFFRASGFTLLNDEANTVGNLINIVGVNDEAILPYGSKRKDLRQLLLNARRDLFTILLRHRPILDRSCLGLFDLQLSGHTHRGQIFPFRFITMLFFPFSYGLFNLGKGSMLYVSSGAGTWGPPVRFLSPPEVTILRIIGD